MCLHALYMNTVIKVDITHVPLHVLPEDLIRREHWPSLVHGLVWSSNKKKGMLAENQTHNSILPGHSQFLDAIRDSNKTVNTEKKCSIVMMKQWSDDCWWIFLVMAKSLKYLNTNIARWQVFYLFRKKADNHYVFTFHLIIFKSFNKINSSHHFVTI